MIIKEYFRHHQSFSQHPLYQHHYESLTKETVNIEIKTDFSKIICQINGKHKYIQQFQHLIKRDTKSPFTNNKKQSVIIDRVQSMNEAMTLYFSPRIDCLMEAATTKKLIKKILVDYFKLFRLPKSHKTKEKKMKMFVVQLFKDKTKFYDSSNLNDDIELLKVKCFPTWTGENVGFLQDYLYRYVTNQSPIKMSIFKLPKFYYETLFIHELTGKPFNIMNLIIDSVSRIDFYRNAPRSMEYLNRLNMIDLEWANILGDGTTAYIVPLVVGRMMEDRTFPATLLFRREYVDKFYETIFHRFHKSNFITSFNEDNAYIATFNARMKGFSTKPSDYYSRMLYLSSPARLGQHRCMGRKTLFNIWLENFYETHQLYTNSSTPYMAIGHTAETHTGRIGSIKPHDHHLLEFLKRMNETNLNGTFLIIQSDHGARYTEYRRTVIGKQEERNPGFFVVTSSSRLRVIFSLYRQRLITAFDHYHLLNVIANATNAYHNLHVNSNKILSFVDASQFNRSKDLLYLNKLIDLETSNRAFSFIPSFSNKYITLYRKCQQSGITPHWCNCMNWRTVPKANQSLIAKAALSSFNGFISQHVILKEKCSMWKLEEIVEMTILTPTSSLLNHTTADQLKKKEYTFVNKDGLTTFYQMKLKLTPVTQQYIAIFEMTILKENGKFKFEQNSLSRLDSYGSQADCLSEKVFARICYCKKF
ncbi:hypothetical protein SNEBB_007474 [Seison nebaliae]|nr:hypothetical protein SNEBB_007474 [Seison nebaliae]